MTTSAETASVVHDETPASSPTVYFDHAATSWPKPLEVVSAVEEGLTALGGNPGRGTYRLAMATARAVHGARKDVAELLGITDPRRLIFQSGCTEALNVALLGLLRDGDRVVVGSMEHNAVARPLRALERRGVRTVVVEADESGVLDAATFARVVREAPTRAIVCQHASNVTGAVQPIADLAEIADAERAMLLVDGAQAGGHLEVELSGLGVAAWACSGHKGLLGPQGIGVLYLAPGCDPDPILFGGTGDSSSIANEQPEALPERYEAGTPNTPGILGLGAGARYLAAHGADQIRAEQSLLARAYEGIRAINGYRIIGPDLEAPRIPVLAIAHALMDAGRLAAALDARWGIAARSGLHCAPWAHCTIGTLDTGVLRLSIGYGNTEAEVDLLLLALNELGREAV